MVRPEPRQRVVRLFVAHDRFSNGVRHIIGILDRFQPDYSAVCKRVRVRRAISNGEDIVQCRAAKDIDIDPVRASRSCCNQRCDSRHNANADDDHIARDCLTIFEQHPGDLAVFSNDLGDALRQADIDALAGVFFGIKVGNGFASDAGEQPVLHFHHGDVAIKLAQDSGRFEPDIASANHDGPLGPRFESFHHSIGIAPVAHVENAFKVRARYS